jgi:hypothetical protein
MAHLRKTDCKNDLLASTGICRMRPGSDGRVLEFDDFDKTKGKTGWQVLLWLWSGDVRPRPLTIGLAAERMRGETGAGKEMFAAAIHKLSPRQSKPFIKLNCAALSG